MAGQGRQPLPSEAMLCVTSYWVLSVAEIDSFEGSFAALFNCTKSEKGEKTFRFNWLRQVYAAKLTGERNFRKFPWIIDSKSVFCVPSFPFERKEKEENLVKENITDSFSKVLENEWVCFSINPCHTKTKWRRFGWLISVRRNWCVTMNFASLCTRISLNRCLQWLNAIRASSLNRVEKSTVSKIGDVVHLPIRLKSSLRLSTNKPYIISLE